jgi:hypothetical protein
MAALVQNGASKQDILMKVAAYFLMRLLAEAQRQAGILHEDCSAWRQ